MPVNLCKICKKEFYIKPSHAKKGWGLYCSRKCRDEGARKGSFVNCDICNKEIWRTQRDFNRSKSKKYFCSKSCQTIWRNKFYSGERHPLWAGGIYLYRKTLIDSKTPIVCKSCGCKDERILVAHHKDCDRKNNKLDNLEWLCRNCHYLIHNY
jgi:hypothetical protein